VRWVVEGILESGVEVAPHTRLLHARLSADAGEDVHPLHGEPGAAVHSGKVQGGAAAFGQVDQINPARFG